MRKVIVRNVFYVIMLLLASCSDGRQQYLHLQKLDSLMEDNPQAVYDSLCLLDTQAVFHEKRNIAMKYQMLKVKAQNKLYLKMPSDSIFQKVVDYYDSYGTANEKMEAYYLLGCIYRDQAEVPMAIRYYHEAIEKADTMSKKCDYATLFSIYGQMAEIDAEQYLYSEAAKATELYSKYALKAGNMYEYIHGKELRIPLYLVEGDTVNAISLTEWCVRQYKKNRMIKEAASVFPTLIEIYVEKHQYDKAKFYMQEYETKSGLFDKGLNVSSGRERYYDIKGRYYWGINELDSAELFFRKLSQTCFKYEFSRGLLTVFNRRMNIDSIHKYSVLCDEESANILEKTQTDAVMKSNAMFNYTRIMKVAENAKVSKERAEYLSILTLLSLTFLTFVFVWRYKWLQSKRRLELTKIGVDFNRVQKELRQTKEELKIVCDNEKKAQGLMKAKMEKLQVEVQEYQLKLAFMENAEKTIVVKENEIVMRFKEMSSPKINNRKPHLEDWNLLEKVVEQYLPLLIILITEKSSLSVQEYRVCILTRLGFTNSEMQVLLNTSSQSITNAKTKANKKLFEENRASSLYKNLLKV